MASSPLSDDIGWKADFNWVSEIVFLFLIQYTKRLKTI